MCVITIYSGPMPYDTVIKDEAKYMANLGPTVKEDRFYAIYNGILTTWFPSSKGYIIQVLRGAGKPDRGYIIVRFGGEYHNPLLVVGLKRPAKWNEAGKQGVLEVLTEYIKGQFDEMQYNTIYALGGIGLHWTVCKMEKDGLPVPTTVLGWHNDISSDLSYDAFKTVAELVYNIH